MKKARNDGLDNLYKNTNYCIECWEEFTLLTDEERENLEKLEILARVQQLNKLFT